MDKNIYENQYLNINNQQPDTRKKISEEKNKPSGKKNILPITEYKKEIKETIAKNDSSLIIGETGSGKTTQIPLMLRELLSKNSDKKIAITQPRRVAAQATAKYTAKNFGCKVGEEVGYQIKGDSKISKDTRLNFLTDGFLLRKMQDDPLLKEYGAVVVDEAHERSLNIDLTLGLLKQIQKKRKEKGMDPLKIIVASATLEKEKFIDYFSGSPAVEVPGRLHKVDTYYEEKKVDDYTKAAAQKVEQIISQKNEKENKAGDILIFMPGKAEIDKTIKEIKNLLLPNTLLIPLHSQISPQRQNDIFRPTKERKIIVATNIAETSLTIPNIRYVIDSGLIKQLEYDPSTGIESLKTQPHAKSGCTQRQGRAGRVAPGKCWRLYTENNFNNRPEFSTPEIQRSELSQVVLRMKKMGIDNITSFDFIDQPPKENIKEAIKSLQLLGALNENEEITKMGEKMAEFPLEPRLARMIIEAEKNNCVEDVCIIAAFLNAPPIFKRMGEDKIISGLKAKKSDFLIFREIWKECVNQNFNAEWAEKNSLFPKTLSVIKETYYDLLKIAKKGKNKEKNWKNYFKQIAESENISEYLEEDISKSVAAGLIENLMEYKGRHAYRNVARDNYEMFYIHPASSLFKKGQEPEYLVADKTLKTSKNYLRSVQEVKPSWLAEIAPQFVRKEKKEIYYDPASNKLKRKINIYLKKGDKFISTGEEEITEENFAPAIAEFFISTREVKFPFMRHNEKVREEAYNLWIRSNGDEIPKKIFSSDYLKNFYQQRLKNFHSLDKLILALQKNEINLNLDLNQLISPEIQKKINNENPSSITISGKKYQVNYEYYEYREIENRLIAYLKISPGEIVKLPEAPTLPSGKKVLFKLTSENNELFNDEQEIDFNQAKEKAKKFLIKKQRDNFDPQRIFDELKARIKQKSLASLPYIIEPELIIYGYDPETDKPLYAYPLLINKPSGLETKCFFSDQEKEEYKKEVIQEKEKVEQKEKTEKEKEKIIKKLTSIKNSLEDAGAGEENNERLKPKQERRLERLINDLIKSVAGYKDTPLPEYWQKEIEEIEEEVKEIKEEKEKTEKAKKMAAEAIKKYCSRCPLCGHPLEDKHCPNALQHERGRIIFPEDEERKGEFKEIWLSQIINEQGKIIAGLKAAPLDKTDRFSAAEIYLELGEEDLETGWLGEPFDSLKFNDFKKIISPEEVKEKMAASEYYRQLKIAKDNVKEGYWRKGIFRKITHPKTGQIIWEKAFRLGTAQIIYEVDQNGHQPTSENLEYFYEEKEEIAADKYHRIIKVEIKKPFPEDIPKKNNSAYKNKKNSKQKNKEIITQNTASSVGSPSQDSLNSLLAKWGKKRK